MFGVKFTHGLPGLQESTNCIVAITGIFGPKKGLSSTSVVVAESVSFHV